MVGCGLVVQGKEGRMFAFLIFDCTFAHLHTTKHRPRSSVEEKFDFLVYVLIFRQQRGQESKGVVFTTTLIARFKFNPHPGHVFSSLEKAFYDDYLLHGGFEQAANSVGNNSKKFTGTLETPKQVWIRPSTKYSNCN